LSKALGSADEPLLNDLAVVRWLVTISAKPATTEGLRSLVVAVEEDTRRLGKAAKGLGKAGDALARVSPLARAALERELGAGWPATLDRLQSVVFQLSLSPGNDRGHPKTAGRFVAEEVARVLAAHGVSLASTETGRFAQVLYVVLASLGLQEMNLHGLVRGVVKARKQLPRSTGW
jgi:hypothetical protein